MASICIYGVGAIGGLLAARLSLAGEQVTGIARGVQLEAIRSDGLTLIQDGARHTVNIECVATPAEAGAHDIVVLAIKSHALPGVASSIAPLLGPDTTVVTACNGLPWWYFHGVDQVGTNRHLEHVDPDGNLWRSIGPERAVGCVVYPAARVTEPGVVTHVMGDRFSLGEPVGGASARVQNLVKRLGSAGFDASIAADIRAEIWLKLVANAAYNPINLLTDTILGEMLDDAETFELLRQVMTEVTAVAAALGVTVPVSPEELMELTRPFAGHRTSMLQDLDAGRSVELDPIVFAVTELARRCEIDTPRLDMIGTLAAQRARLGGCYQSFAG